MIVQLYHMVNSREFIANICKFGLGESLTLELKQYTPDSPQGPQGYGAWSNLQVSNRIKTAPPRIVSPASVATDALQLLELLVDRHPHNAARYVCSCGGVNMVSTPRIRSCSGSAARREMMRRSVLNMFAAKLCLTVPEVNWSSEGMGGLIPHEEKWTLINHSTYLFRGGGDLIPYEEKWKLTNHSTFEEKWKLTNHSTYSGGGGLIRYED